ncbi:insulin-like growth factor 1 receptor [Aphomia sociella]
MAAKSAVIWLNLLGVFSTFGQRLENRPFHDNGVCGKMICNSLEKLKELENCTVVVGDLHVSRFNNTKREDFENFSFNLREVTGFVVFYAVMGLESLGQLFPNLTRIRGSQVITDYALIIYDMPDLKEIGLYSLLKIDRGGVIIWGTPQACYLNTINWKIIAPRSRHVIDPWDVNIHCVSSCRCTSEPETNYCWNYKKCQRHIEGPEADTCHDECLGCRKTNSKDCSACQNYTYKGHCVSKCPNDTLVLQVNKYCLSKDECFQLKGWPWYNECVFDCPIGFIKSNISNKVSCKPCLNCHKTCDSLIIQTTNTIQSAQRCVYINGSLTIHVRAIPAAMAELKTYLGQIEEVSDYIVIYGSLVITSLEFLSSLRYIGGRNLKNNKYSLVVDNMINLQSLFTSNVTSNLKIGRGALNFSRNPVLCISHIEKIYPLFPQKPDQSEHLYLLQSNGYSGGCKYASVGLQIRVVNESSALVMFTPMEEPDVHYTILYIRLPVGTHKMYVPETCSDAEWHAINVPVDFGNTGLVELSSLHPASTYALCIETYDTPRKYLARSTIFNFTTPVGKPEPPFISELVANSPTLVVLRWVDHKVYRPHITRYELDLTVIDIDKRKVMMRNHCKENNVPMIDYLRHAVVMTPPPAYDKSCESMCGILSNVAAGSLVQEYFDFCEESDSGCNIDEEEAPGNSSFGKFVRTMFLNISGPKNDFQVGGLAPYRDYRFRLRACAGNNCSRSARGVVRTLYSDYADVPTITYVSANEDGYITVKWNSPEYVNGIVLSYSVQVLIPKMIENDDIEFSPNVWCVSADKLNFVVKYIPTKKYYVRVCSSTLAQSSACGEWVTVIAITEYIQVWWIAIILGLLLFIVSTAAGMYWKRRVYNDNIPLLDITSMYRTDSEPPALMFTDFVPIPLNIDNVI